MTKLTDIGGTMLDVGSVVQFHRPFHELNEKLGVVVDIKPTGPDVRFADPWRTVEVGATDLIWVAEATRKQMYMVGLGVLRPENIERAV